MKKKIHILILATSISTSYCSNFEHLISFENNHSICSEYNQLINFPTIAQKFIQGLNNDEQCVFFNMPESIRNELFQKKYYFLEQELKTDCVRRAMFDEKINEYPIQRNLLLKLLEFYQDNPDNQKVRYQFFSKKVGTVNIVDTKKAHEILIDSLKKRQPWSIFEYVKSDELPKGIQADLNLISTLANYGQHAAQKLLYKKFPNIFEKVIDIFNDFDEINELEDKLWKLYSLLKSKGFGFPLKKLGDDLYKESNDHRHIAFYAYKLAAILGDEEAKERWFELKDYKNIIKNLDGSPDVNTILELISCIQQGAELEEPIALYNMGLFMRDFLNQTDINLDDRILKSFFNPKDLQKLNSSDLEKTLKNKAFELLSKAADLGHVAGFNDAGLMLNREFPEKGSDIDKALEFFYKGADLGNTNCMYNAASILIEKKLNITSSDRQITLINKSITSDPSIKSASELFLKAAEEGNEESIFNAGILYANGILVPRDPKKAEKYLLKSFENGNDCAALALGNLYLTIGKFEDAIVFLTHAKNKNSQVANDYLKLCYSIIKDPESIPGDQLIKIYDTLQEESSRIISDACSDVYFKLSCSIIEDSESTPNDQFIENDGNLKEAVSSIITDDIQADNSILIENIKSNSSSKDALKKTVSDDKLPYFETTHVENSSTQLNKHKIIRQKKSDHYEKSGVLKDIKNESQKKFVNLKTTMRAVGDLLNKCIEVDYSQLNKDNLEILISLKTKSRPVDLDELENLLKDKVFGTHVICTPTTKGKLFTVRNGSDCFTFNAHPNHDRNYKGLDYKCINECIRVLETLYGDIPEVLYRRHKR